MAGPEQILAPAIWINNTVLTGTSSHKNGQEKQQVLLSLSQNYSLRRKKSTSVQVARTEHLPAQLHVPRVLQRRSSCPQAHHGLCPRHIPSSAAPQHRSIAPGTYFPVRPPPEGPQGFWQLLHHKPFSQLLHEDPHARRAHKQPAAVSASG